MMLSEVDSWIREDSDTDLGPPLGEGEASARYGQGNSGSADLDDFLCEDDQPQGNIWSAPQTPLYNDGRTQPNEVEVERPRDSWPLLVEPESITNSRVTDQVSSKPTTALERGPTRSLGPATIDENQCLPTTVEREKSRLSGFRKLGKLLQKSVDGCTRKKLFASGFRGACRKAYYSRMMGYLYLGVLALNAWILLKCIILSPIDAPLVLAESFVTLMLILEVSLRAVVMGPAFFSSCAHLFDCVVSILCVALLVGSGDLQTLTRRARPPEAPDDVLRQSLTALRIATQLMRVVPLALHQKRARLPRDGVDFSRLNSADDL